VDLNWNPDGIHSGSGSQQEFKSYVWWWKTNLMLEAIVVAQQKNRQVGSDPRAHRSAATCKSAWDQLVPHVINR
jgi:hypothetical protein